MTRDCGGMRLLPTVPNPPAGISMSCVSDTCARLVSLRTDGKYAPLAASLTCSCSSTSSPARRTTWLRCSAMSTASRNVISRGEGSPAVWPDASGLTSNRPASVRVMPALMVNPLESRNWTAARRERTESDRRPAQQRDQHQRADTDPDNEVKRIDESQRVGFQANLPVDDG